MSVKVTIKADDNCGMCGRKRTANCCKKVDVTRRGNKCSYETENGVCGVEADLVCKDKPEVFRCHAHS